VVGLKSEVKARNDSGKARQNLVRHAREGRLCASSSLSWDRLAQLGCRWSVCPPNSSGAEWPDATSASPKVNRTRPVPGFSREATLACANLQLWRKKTVAIQTICPALHLPVPARPPRAASKINSSPSIHRRAFHADYSVPEPHNCGAGKHDDIRLQAFVAPDRQPTTKTHLRLSRRPGHNCCWGFCLCASGVGCLVFSR
jgi:hypothetical protein